MREHSIGRRTKILALLGITIAVLLGIIIAGEIITETAYGPDYSAKKLAPSMNHLFGTDYLGRDMFYRTIKGLSMSIKIGLLAAAISSFLALILGVLSALIGGNTDKLIMCLTDLCMGVPHLVMLILVSFMLGKGEKGVIIGVALTHWPSLTRIIRAEAMQIRSMPYVQLASRLGRNTLQIAVKHIMPHIIPQFLVGFVLLFPHAILHEAAVTFLGFGLPLDQPAIGAILSEAMKHLATGMWWLVIFPGIALLIVVMMFEALGENLKFITDPYTGQE